MQIQHLDDFVAVPISTEMYMEIAGRYPGGVTSLIESVVGDFLVRTEEDYAMPSTNGIYWGAVFLPSGTKLRLSYRNEYKYAEVEEDQIVYEGEAVPSVSKMASMMRNNTSVNAWTYVELMRPTDKAWVIANKVRRG